MRVDYNFYVENFGGSQVPERAWFSLEMKAENVWNISALEELHVIGQKKTGNKMQSMQSVK